VQLCIFSYNVVITTITQYAWPTNLKIERTLRVWTPFKADHLCRWAWFITESKLAYVKPAFLHDKQRYACSERQHTMHSLTNSQHKCKFWHAWLSKV